jgi:HNH endonuclease
MVVDHSMPRNREAKTEFENLCFACHRCNKFKGATIAMEDPLTGESVRLFHPRQQRWTDHFSWDVTGTRIIGLTAAGRVTVIALKMNNKVIIDARQNRVSVGWHSPDM